MPRSGSRPSALRTRPPALDAAAWVTGRLHALDATLGETLPRVHGSLDGEALHDMRVAVRKLRVLLRLARPVFGRFYADAVCAPFTAVHRATSALRDEEVLEATLEKLPVSDAAFVAWRKRRKVRARALRRDVLGRLERGEIERARAQLGALLALPVRPRRRGRLGPFARDGVENARREVERLRDTPPDDAAGLHALRIAYKKLRYAIELFSPVLPADVAAMGEPAKRFQQRLGDLHDLDVALAVIARSRLPVATRTRALRRLRSARAVQVRVYLADAAPALQPPPALGTSPTRVPAARPRPKKSSVRRRRPRVLWRGTLSRP